MIEMGVFGVFRVQPLCQVLHIYIYTFRSNGISMCSLRDLKFFFLLSSVFVGGGRTFHADIYVRQPCHSITSRFVVCWHADKMLLCR